MLILIDVSKSIISCMICVYLSFYSHTLVSEESTVTIVAVLELYQFSHETTVPGSVYSSISICDIEHNLHV